MAIRFSPRWLTIPAAAAAVTAVVMAHPGEGVAGGVPPDAVWVADPDVVATARDLEAKHDAVAHRINYKEDLIDGLVAGRAGLTAVAAEFLRLNQDAPACLDVVRQQFPGGTDEEKSARNVIEYVRVRPLPAGERTEVVSRLEREFAARFGAY